MNKKIWSLCSAVSYTLHIYIYMVEISFLFYYFKHNKGRTSMPEESCNGLQLLSDLLSISWFHQAVGPNRPYTLVILQLDCVAQQQFVVSYIPSLPKWRAIYEASQIKPRSQINSQALLIGWKVCTNSKIHLSWQTQCMNRDRYLCKFNSRH